MSFEIHTAIIMKKFRISSVIDFPLNIQIACELFKLISM